MATGQVRGVVTAVVLGLVTVACGDDTPARTAGITAAPATTAAPSLTLVVHEGTIEVVDGRPYLVFVPMCVSDGVEACAVTGELTFAATGQTLTASGAGGLRFAVPPDLAAGGFGYELSARLATDARVVTAVSASVPGEAAEEVTVDLGARAASAVLAPTVVYRAERDDGAFGMGTGVDDVADGPAGFGVDARGVVHAVDGANHRVIRIAPDGALSAVPLPEELSTEVVAGFAVAPDGTEFVSLHDGVAAVRDGKLLRRFTGAELGVVGTMLRLEARSDGLYVPAGSSWARAVDTDLHLVPRAARTPLLSARGERITVTADPGAIVVAEGPRSYRLVSRPQVQAVYVADQMRDGSLVVLARSPSAGQPDNTQIVVVSPDGSYHHAAIEVPTENMVQNGMYAAMIDDRVYVEVGDATSVSILRFDPSDVIGVEA